MMERDIRSDMFRNATRFVDYEMIQGDIFEFGVYTGRSLALLAYYHELNKRDIHRLNFTRRVVGLDSFEGLPGSDGHPRWKTGLFKTNHSFHPICKDGEAVCPETVCTLFGKYKLPLPMIEVGRFETTLEALIPDKYSSAAIVHVDCDLYRSTKTVLTKMHEIFQEGTLLLFDDWFNFRGRVDKGEQKAFWEYQKAQAKWSFVEYQNYATFGKPFITNFKRRTARRKMVM